MKIITDSREQQRPYDNFLTDSIIGKLDTGDYSISGLENNISIERIIQATIENFWEKVSRVMAKT